MKNKYRINTRWDPDGPRYIYDVIMSLMKELNESLEVPMMEESKSDEEVGKILDNPEGITIKELQVIDVWKVDKRLRREVRHRLDLAYRHLSAETTHLIATRNDMENKGLDKSNKIDAKNGELKNTIVNQYKVIEKRVQDYEQKGESSEKERKLLVYIRKVYLKALSEIIERLFLTASKSTKRVEIFPRDEQKEMLDKISELQGKISLLTWENKQKQKEQQRENDKKLELEKKRLEEEVIVFKNLKDKINSSFPNLVDNENEVDEEVQKNIERGLIKLEEIQKQVSEKSQIIKRVIEDLNNLRGGADNKISQAQEGLNRVETRELVEKFRTGLKEIATELQKEVDLRNSSERENKTGIEYQNQQIQLPKK